MSRVDFETLNAYVDGELDPARAADVARAVAEDPGCAGQVSALSRLRTTVAESIEAPPVSLPERPVGAGRGVAVAASIALVAFIAGSVLVASLDPGPPGESWLTRAWQAHAHWSLEDADADSRPTLGFAPVSEAVPGAYVPDLSASRLSLVRAVVVSFGPGTKALLAGYRGTRGCKISLLMFPAPPDLGDMTAFHRANDEAYGWRAGALGYVILSDGMDSARFRLLAESVREASHRRLPFDNETRMALRESRDRSAPCLA